MKLIRFLPISLQLRIIAKRVGPYTLLDLKRLGNLFNLARKVEQMKLPGDIVECGVYNGGSGAVLAYFSTDSRFNRTLWMFDSFEGMPHPTDNDDDTALVYSGKLVGDINNVLSVLKLVGADPKHIRIVKGWFEKTFDTVHINQISLLHIDADWYESVKLCLERFYDAVVQGGIIIIDDYGHWSGCKRAVDDFFISRQITTTLNEVGYTARWFQKS